MPILVCERGPEKGLTLRIGRDGTYVCGRDPASTQIVLTDVMTSRRHFEIRCEGNGFILEDLESRNGTFLNDEPVQGAVPLKIGDKIQVGDTMFSFLTDRKEETPQGLVGKKAGGYEILERIGRGGMGTVFRARQLSLNRDVALKVLSARLLKDPDFVERFQNEARAAGQLNHPNIVQVYDVGASQGLHYFSMEFMENGSVQDQIGKDGKIPWEQALDMMIDAARGLVFAERNEIVHRDIKPDNLMLSADGSVKIGDLGLATRKEQAGGGNKGGSIFGTPHFISPEQAQGLEVGHAADLYSLGATFYRILSGRTPFLGEQVQAIIRQQIVEEPPPLRELAPEVPQAIAAVISRLMRKDPAERYPSAADLVEELEAIRMTHHPAMRSGRKGLLVGVIAAAVVVLGVVAFILFRPKNEEPPPPIIIQGTVQGTTTEVDPETTAELRRVRAEAAWLKIRGTAPDGGSVTEANHADEAWDTLLAELESRVLDPYADTPSAEEAIAFRDRVMREREEIRARLEAERRAEEQRTEAVRKAWKTLQSRVLELVAAKKFAEALEALESSESQQDIMNLAETQSAFLSLKNRIQREAREHSTARLGEVDRLEAAGRTAQALEKLDEFLDRWNPNGRTEQIFARVRKQAEERRSRLQETLKRTRAENLGHDFDAYLAAYRKVRHLDAEEPNAVFDYDFAAAAEALRKTLDGEDRLRSWPYRERMRVKVEDLDRMERFMRTFTETMKAGRATDLELAIEGMGTLTPRGRILAETVSREGFTARYVKSGSIQMQKPFEFGDFSPRQLWQGVLLEGRRIPLEPRDRLDLMLLLAEIGVHEGIARIVEDLGPVEDLPEEIREDARTILARLESERAAAAEYASIQEDRHRPGLDAAALAALLERLRKFEVAYAQTDFFLLIGGSPPAGRGLVPDEQVRRYMNGLDQPR